MIVALSIIGLAVACLLGGTACIAWALSLPTTSDEP
jgi:hypothetical protein